MKLLTKADILQANDLQVELVATPEWGGDTAVRGLTGDERDRFEQHANAMRWPEKGEPDWTGMRALYCSMGICDMEGNSLGFTEAELVQLGKKGAALERVYDRIRKLSGMGIESLEEAEKNLPATQSESSG